MARNWQRSVASAAGLLCWLPVVAQAQPVVAQPQPAAPVRPAATGCAGQEIPDPSFEQGPGDGWSGGFGVITKESGEAPHTGSWYAWLDGYGTTHTDTLTTPPLTLPAGCHLTFSYWLHIDTAETTTSTAYDTLTVQGIGKLASYSNLDHNIGYQQHSFVLSSSTGLSFRITFTGTEDRSLQTSFVLDDVTATLS